MMADLVWLVTVKTAEGYFELAYPAATAKEAKEWGRGLDGVTEVVHVTVKV